MELRHLRYFVAVAESLHFGEAAAHLGIAQPSLSQQIAALEAELKTSLFKRTRRRVELTDAGRLFLEDARDILGRADRAALVARHVGRNHGGRLRVGIGYCMDHSALVRAVTVFSQTHPKVRVELRTMSVQRQADAIRSGALDIGFIRRREPEETLLGDLVATDGLLLAVPRRHRLASSKRAVALSHLADEAFVLPTRELVPVYHDIVLRTCREAGFVPTASQEADQLPTLLHFVGAGCGITLLPAFTVRMKVSRVVFVGLRPSSTPLSTVITWHRHNQQSAVTDFVAVARRAFAISGRRVELALRRRLVVWPPSVD